MNTYFNELTQSFKLRRVPVKTFKSKHVKNINDKIIITLI